MDIRQAHAIAVELAVDATRDVQPRDLPRATPCADWNLGELLVHMVSQSHGFRAAAGRTRTTLAQWMPTMSAVEALAGYADAERALVVALDGLQPRDPMWLPELTTRGPFDASEAIGFHLIDSVVHGWDVAVSCGRRYELPESIAGVALEIAMAVPDGPNRERESANFARPIPPTGADELTQILCWLGRPADWLAPEPPCGDSREGSVRTTTGVREAPTVRAISDTV